MAKPIVAIVGRPNVGKSTIFNKLTGQRLAIVEDTPGVTRDRIFCDCEWSGRKFLLVGTGIFFTIKLHFVQLSSFADGVRHLFKGFSLHGKAADKDGMSSFQA